MNMNSPIRTYSELITIESYLDRFEYLRLDGEVGVETFGFDRWMNQQFYHSDEWKRVKRQVILRDTDGDNVLDMAHPDYPVKDLIIVHHMNPIRFENMSDLDWLLNPEYLVCVSHPTHMAIHYGNEIFVQDKEIVIRKPNDTCPWKGGRL